MTTLHLLHILVGLPFGVLVGWAYFALLSRNVEQYLGSGPVGPALLLHVGRWFGIVAAFWAAARFAGAHALLAMLVGFVIARTVWTRRRVGQPQC